MKTIGILLLFIAIMEIMFGTLGWLLSFSLAVVGIVFLLKSKQSK